MPRINENLKIIILTVSAILILCIVFIILTLFKVYFSFLTLKSLKTDLILTRGIIYESIGDYKEAKEDFIYVLTHNTHKGITYIGMGDVELRAGHYIEAIDNYSNALRLKPECIYAYVNRAKAKSAIGDKIGAVSDLNEFQSKISPVNMHSKTNPNRIQLQTDKSLFEPYINELQQKIKSNWGPPKINSRKIAVASFNIDKSGNLLTVVIKKSSGEESIDKAAILAIKNSAPFKPLPKGYKGKHIIINYTFDYNVLKK